MSDTRRGGRHPALTDEDTGFPNRLHFETVFDVVFASGARGFQSTVLLLEIEGFRDWASGRKADEAARLVRDVGKILVPLVRRTDLLARTDEARFTMVLVDCNLAGAVLVADRIDGELDPIRESTGLGFSLGGAGFDPDMNDPEDQVNAAETALLAAQSRGPDQMEFHR
jgi:diguanylate cyclase (GGDEF)-like protein